MLGRGGRIKEKRKKKSRKLGVCELRRGENEAGDCGRLSLQIEDFSEKVTDSPKYLEIRGIDKPRKGLSLNLI